MKTISGRGCVHSYCYKEINNVYYIGEVSNCWTGMCMQWNSEYTQLFTVPFHTPFQWLQTPIFPSNYKMLIFNISNHLTAWLSFKFISSFFLMDANPAPPPPGGPDHSSNPTYATGQQPFKCIRLRYLWKQNAFPGMDWMYSAPEPPALLLEVIVPNSPYANTVTSK